MKYYNIDNTDLTVSSIIMGCMRIDSLSKQELNALIQYYLDNGVNFFDHADVYGMGSCERLFGEAMALSPGIRDRMLIQGKCGIRKENGHCYYDFSTGYLLESVDNILKRLNIEQLDVLLLHRPDALMEPEEVAAAFTRLKESGKVRYFGLSNATPAQFELLGKYVGERLIFDQVQLGVGHTPLIDFGMCVNTGFPQGVDRTGSLLEYTRLHDISIQAWSPLQYGMFEGIIFGQDKYSQLCQTLEKIAGEHGVSAPAAAIAWILRHPAKIQVICGSTKPKHVLDYLKAAETELTRAEWYKIYESAGNPIP